MHMYAAKRASRCPGTETTGKTLSRDAHFPVTQCATYLPSFTAAPCFQLPTTALLTPTAGRHRRHYASS